MLKEKGFLYLAAAVAVGVAASGIVLWAASKLMSLFGKKEA